MNLKKGCYMEPTSYLRKIDKADSDKYNFALFESGTMEKMNIKLIGLK